MNNPNGLYGLIETRSTVPFSNQVFLTVINEIKQCKLMTWAQILWLYSLKSFLHTLHDTFHPVVLRCEKSFKVVLEALFK